MRCGHQRIAYNSCRNRHCPKCQGKQRARWLAAEQAMLLPVPYFHVVFTLPARARTRWCARTAAVLYDAALPHRGRHAAHLRARSPSPRCRTGHHHGAAHLGADPHRALPRALRGLGRRARARRPRLDPLCPRATKKHRRRPFLFPVPPSPRCFAASTSPALKRRAPPGELHFAGQSAALADPATVASAPRLPRADRLGGVLQAPLRRPRARPEIPQPLHPPRGHLQRRLALRRRRRRCASRTATTPTTAPRKEMTLPATEFLRRFLLHVVPRGFMRIRHYGLLGQLSAPGQAGRAVASCWGRLPLSPARRWPRPPPTRALALPSGSRRRVPAAGHRCTSSRSSPRSTTPHEPLGPLAHFCPHPQRVRHAYRGRVSPTPATTIPGPPGGAACSRAPPASSFLPIAYRPAPALARPLGSRGALAKRARGAVQAP